MTLHMSRGSIMRVIFRGRRAAFGEVGGRDLLPRAL